MSRTTFEKIAWVKRIIDEIDLLIKENDDKISNWRLESVRRDLDLYVQDVQSTLKDTP